MFFSFSSAASPEIAVFSSSLKSERISNITRYEIGSFKGRQVNPKKSVLVIAYELGSNCPCQGALADCIGSSDGDEPVLSQLASQLFNDLVPSNQSCDPRRQIVRRPENLGSRRSKSEKVIDPTKQYPRPGTVTKYLFPSRPSPRARRSAAILTLRFASTTTVSGQTRSMSSRLVTSLPGCSKSAIKISRARLPTRTSLPAFVRSRWLGSKRNGPNEISRSVEALIGTTAGVPPEWGRTGSKSNRETVSLS